MTERWTGIFLWDDVPPEQRADDRLCPIWGTRVTHRGCAGAVRWPDGQGYHRCATIALKEYGFCRRHGVLAGVIPPTPERGLYPRALDPRIGNIIMRNTGWGRSTMTVSEFRQLDDETLLTWRNAGQAALPGLRLVRDTWPDDDLIQTFGFQGVITVCNWVGEGVPA